MPMVKLEIIFKQILCRRFMDNKWRRFRQNY